ncbi:MAG: T9SS type A sorting domain-containing protein [Bacteroidales bacterium]|nr:T9SS type A sorting domain-containing protein [Bacteroidales bacterium]
MFSKVLVLQFVFIFFYSVLPAQNLIVNPGAELAPTSNGWKSVSGSWGSGSEITAYEGSYHFFAGAGAGPFEIYQDIDVSGYADYIDASYQRFIFSGWIADWNGSDKARIIVEFRDASNAVLESYNTGEQGTTTWTQYTDTRTAPVGTRAIRIRLISTRYDGTDNDGYLDDLSLTTTYIGPTQGPGGVTSNNVFWVKANRGIVSSSSNVSQWNDHSGNGSNAIQGTSANQPSISNVVRNYNPSVYFDGTNENMGMSDLIPSTNTSLSLFAVGSNETGGDDWHAMVFGQTSSSWSSGGYGLCALSTNNQTFGCWVNDYSANRVSTTWIDEPISVLEGEYDGSNVEFFINSASQGTDSYTGQVDDNGNTYLGGGPATSYNHKGYISEVIIFDNNLSSTNRAQMNSYLAIKYGITLNRTGNPNYLATDGSTIYTASSTYWNNIIGIGSDITTDLSQKQSHSSDDTTRLYIGSLSSSNSANAETFESDTSYVVMGGDGGKMCATTASNAEAPSGIESRIEREWQITFSNFNQIINIEMQLSSCADISNIVTSDLRLLYDTDGDFSNAAILNPSATASYVNASGLITISIDMSGVATSPAYTTFITLGSIDADNTPLPIELLSFDAKLVENQNVQLDWQTATETNNDFFSVERSQKGLEWEPISIIQGNGNSNQLLNYQTVDYKPLNGISYYRLKQTDFDGKFSYSNTVTVNRELDKNSLVSIYPNPATGFIYMNVENVLLDEIAVYNSMGQNVTSNIRIKRKKENQFELDLSALPNGVYLIRTLKTYSKVIKQ